MKHEKSCGCIIINDKSEVLIIHSNLGHWGFPKGHIEEGETEEQTAKREVKEETNLEIIIDTNYRYKIEYSPKENVMKEVIFFLAKNITNNIKPQLEELQEVKWLPLEEAIDYITYPDEKAVLEQLKKDINIKGGE